MRIRTTRLPAGYRELKWIESTGTQYIDTLVNMSNGGKVECVAKAINNPSTIYISGAETTVAGNRHQSFLIGLRNGYYVGYLGNAGGDSIVADQQKHHFVLEGKTNSHGFFTVDNMPSIDLGVIVQITWATLALFASHWEDNSYVTHNGIIQLWNYKIYNNNDALIRNYIPCERESDGEIGLYDLTGSICSLTNTPFYTNSGTGDFIKGPYVNDGYKAPIIIEEGTTNLGGTSTTYSNFSYNTQYSLENWGGAAGNCWYYKSGGYNDAPYVKYTCTATGSGGAYKDTTDNMTLVYGKTYTMSCYIKASCNLTLNQYGFSLNRHSDNRYQTYGNSFALTTNWKRFSATFTIYSTGNYCVRNIIYSNVPVGESVYWSAFQLEEKDHATPFVIGTRPDNYLQSCRVAELMYGYNQQVGNGNYLNGGTGWDAYSPGNLRVSVNDQELTAEFLTNLGSSSTYIWGFRCFTEKPVYTHKYLILVNMYTSYAGTYAFDYNNYASNKKFSVTSSELNRWIEKGVICVIDLQHQATQCILFPYPDCAIPAGAVIKCNRFMIIDLTDWYGAGREPTTISEFRERFPNDYYGYIKNKVLFTKGMINELPLYGYNQLFVPCTSSSNWIGNDGSIVFNSDESMTITTTSNPNYAGVQMVSSKASPFYANHKYLFACDCYADTKAGNGALFGLNLYSVNSGYVITEQQQIPEKQWYRDEKIFTVSRNSSGTIYPWLFINQRTDRTIGDKVTVRRPMFIDLTDWYGLGNEPSTIAEFKATFPHKYYEYYRLNLLNRHMINMLGTD